MVEARSNMHLTKNSNFSKIIIKENRILVGQNAKGIKILRGRKNQRWNL